jgi:hypothetical protein
MNPIQIRRLFEQHWTGTDKQLDEALEAFFKDIQSSYALATTRTNEAAASVVNDYVGNHYFS